MVKDISKKIFPWAGCFLDDGSPLFLIIPIKAGYTCDAMFLPDITICSLQYIKNPEPNANRKMTENTANFCSPIHVYIANFEELWNTNSSRKESGYRQSESYKFNNKFQIQINCGSY
jgi:hypothetical protein